MMDVKTVISILAVVLTFVGYVPYTRDVLKGKTKPHIFSWFIWGISTFVIYALQVKAGGGSGSWVTLSVAIIMLFIFFLAFKYGEKDIKNIDIAFLVSALLALFFWFFVEQPIVSMVLLTAVDVLGFLPTIRKSWNNPESETLSTYAINGFRHALSVFALAEYNLITVLFPATWAFINASFIVMLVVRRARA